MQSARFISPPLSGWLDLVRALAALAVVVGHTHLLGLYTGPYPFTHIFELNAVVVFFVLSGMVIASSADRDCMDGRRYVAARVARIVPVAWAALAISYGIALYGQSQGLPPKSVGMDPGGVSLVRALRAAIFLDQSWTGGLAINPPWWSLSCEVWFYVLFGLGTWLKGPKRIAALALAGLMAGTNVLLMLPIWLVGVLLVRLPALRNVSLVGGTALVLVAFFSLQASVVAYVLLEPITLPIAALYPGHSQYALGYLAVALGVAGGFAGLRALVGERGFLPARIMPAVNWAANMSFSLYVLHWPLLVLLKANGITAGTSLAGFFGIIALVGATSGLFAHLVEHRREPLRRWLEQVLGAAQRISTNSSAIEGCSATVASKSALVSLACTAMAAAWRISGASGPIM